MVSDKVVEIFSKYPPVTPLTIDESMFLVSILLDDDKKRFDVLLDDVDKNSEIYTHFKPIFESFQVQVFVKRLTVLTPIKITLGALIMLSFQLYNAGAAVLMVYYLLIKLSDDKIVDLDVYTMKLFPFGVFSEEQLHEIWVELKNVTHIE